MLPLQYCIRALHPSAVTRRLCTGAVVPFVVLMFCSLPTLLPAQRKDLPARLLAVDVVVLKDGRRLYGACLSHQQNHSIVFVVQREWLKKQYPKRYQELITEEHRQQREAPQIRLQRLRCWIAERADAPRLLPFLQAELKRLEKRQLRKKPGKKTPGSAAQQKTQFVRLKISRDQIRGGYQQPPLHRQIALLAWRERLKKVESRSAIALARELREKGIRLDGKPVNLSDRLPPDTLETDRQWAARKALVEYDYLKRLRFQGTDTVLFRAGGDASASPSVLTIFSRLWKSQIDDLLKELQEPHSNRHTQMSPHTSSFQKAVQTARKEKVQGFRITRVGFSLQKKEVTVEEQFVARMPDDQWTIVWKHRETIDAAQNRPELEKRIKEDERVKKALQLIRGLGLSPRKDQMELAFRFAAAVQIAQEKADEKFNDFRNAYSRSLDTPPILWRE